MRNLVLCLPFSPHEIPQARELVRLWVDLEDKFNNSVALLIFSRFDIEPESIGQDIIGLARTRFRVITQRSKRKGVGWPAGCNAIEIGAYEWFVEKNRHNPRGGDFDFPYILFAECDTVPLRKGWIEEIMNEAYDSKAIMLGAYFTKKDGCAHINGNCVLHRDAWKTIRKIWKVPSGIGWDCYIGPQALSHGTPSKLIWQDYRLGTPENPWKGDDFLFEEKGFPNPGNPLHGQRLKPAMLHGVKTLEAISAVRKRCLS